MKNDVRTFVISLSESEPRRQHMKNELSCVGIDWCFFDAIKIKEYPADYDSRYRQKWFGFDLTLGEIGCFLSHRELWKNCADSGVMFLILEDDIKIKNNFLQAIEFAKENQNRFGILRLMQLQKRNGHKVFSDKNFTALTFHEQPSGAQGYFITPKASKILLSYTRKILEPVDNMMDHYWRTGLDVFCLDPPAIEEAMIGSDIGERGWKRRPKWQGLKRDLRTGVTELYRRYYNYKKYKSFIF